MAQLGSTLSVAAIAGLEAMMDRLQQMMEEANAGMCSTLNTLASATRSSAPSSSTSPASSTPTTAPTAAAPSSTTARTAAPTPTTITMLSAIDECVVTWSACCNHATASPAYTTLTTSPSELTAAPTVAAIDVHHVATPASAISSTEDDAINTSPTKRSTHCLSVNTDNDHAPIACLHREAAPKDFSALALLLPPASLGAQLVFDGMPNRYTTIDYPTRSNGVSMFGISTNVPEVLVVIEKVPGQTSEVLWLPSFMTCCPSLLVCSTGSCVFDRGKSSKGEFIFTVILPCTLLQAVISNFVLGIHSLTLQIELKPWPNWHGHQGSLIVALVCPHSSIVIWVQFSCAVHKLLVWPLHCESWWECYADCLQLLVSAWQVDSIKMEAIGLIQLHIAIPVTELYCLLFTCYHQPVHWKPQWLSLVYIISNIPYIAYSLRIRTPPLKNINSLLTDTCVLCSQSWQPFSNGQLDVLLRQPWPPPLLFDLMGSDGPLKPTPWPSFCESAAALHLQNSSALVLAISLTAVQTSSVWQEVSGKALDFINLLPTLCSHTGQGLYQLKIVISYKHSHELLFSLSQYASLLLHSSQWCFGQLWKPPWPCQGHVLANGSESVVQVFLWPLPVQHVISVVSMKLFLILVSRWQQKCDGTIKWNDFLLLDGDLIITWSTTEERRAANCMRHGSCYCCVVWGGPIILVFVPASGHLLGGETLLRNIWLVQKWQHSHNPADASFPIYLIGLNSVLAVNGCGNNHLCASELYSILMQPYHSWLSLSETKCVGGNSVMLHFSVATCMILSPVNYNNSNNGSVFHQWLIFAPVLELLHLPCYKPCSSAGKLLFVWIEPYVIQISSNMQILYLCIPTQHYGLLYSGRPVLLPLASAILLAWCDNEELEHDMIILPGPQATISVGLPLHLIVFGLTDFHGNAADQSYFLGAWEAIYSECFASTVVLPMVPVIQFQAYPSLNSKTMEVMYKTLTNSSMLALQFYNLTMEDP